MFACGKMTLRIFAGSSFTGVKFSVREYRDPNIGSKVKSVLNDYLVETPFLIYANEWFKLYVQNMVIKFV